VIFFSKIFITKCFLFGQKFHGLCVCVWEIRHCHQLWPLLPAAIFLFCHWWQSVLWVSVTLIWKIKQHFDISHSQKNVTTQKTLILSYTHRRYAWDHTYLRLFSKMAARGEKCHSFDATVSPWLVVFLSPKKLNFLSCDSVLLGVWYHKMEHVSQTFHLLSLILIKYCHICYILKSPLW
jgi:hypothetical protein